MMKRRQKLKNNMLIVFGTLFLIGLSAYFLFRDVYNWIGDIIPEFLGILLLGFFITFALKGNISFKTHITFLSLAVIIGIIAYIYGLNTNIRVLKDLAPELLGSTGLSLVLSIMFKKRMWQ